MNTIFIAFTLKNSSVAEFFVTLSNFLSRDYKVFIFSHASEDHNFNLCDSITVLNWPSRRPTKFKDLRFLLQQIREHRPVTLIGNFAAVNVFMLGGIITKVRHRIAWYHTLTTQLEQDRILRLRKKFFYKMATDIITNSEAAKLDLVQFFKIDRKKVQVVNNAVKNPGINAGTESNKIVYAGRLHQIKGVEVLVRALAIVKERFQKIELTIIGDDENTGELVKLKNLQNELNLNDNINFVGNRSRNYVLKEFSKAYCTIVPSFFEAFGYVVIESFSVHTPVVGSNTTGVSEIIRDKKDGLLFEPGNHEELAEKLIGLLSNQELRSEMADNCYNRFREMYELNKVAKSFSENLHFFN